MGSPATSHRVLRTTPRFYRAEEAHRNPHTVMHELLLEYGDLVCWRGLQDICLVNHPDLIRPILTQEHPHFSKNTFNYHVLRQVLGNGLVTNDGPDWARQRRLVQPAFASRRVARFDETINARTSALVAHWERRDSGEVVWIDREMSSLTFGILGETLFGRDIGEHADEMAEILEVVNLPSHDPRALLTLNPRISTPFTRKWKQAMKRLDDIVFGIIAEHDRHPDRSHGIVDLLFAARDEETGEGMDERQIRDEVVTLMFAGHETVATGLSWTLYLLTVHPDIQERLAEDVETNLDGEPAATEDLARLPYLRQVVQEAMRIYPPVWGFMRRTEHETELGGTVIPAETTLGVVTYALHRHPELWPDPERFDPDRFAPDQARDRDFFAYLPFSAGPRTCIGAGMAMLETQLILAQIVPRFRMRVVPDHPIETEARITLMPRHGIPVTLNRRPAGPARRVR